jgi:hypothetical protein
VKKLLLLIVSAVVLLPSCARRFPEGRSGPKRAYQLIRQTPERETAQLKEKRDDLEVDTPDFERIPRVVASHETGVMELAGARARLYGDQDGSMGWGVDNFLLIEILDAKENILDRAVVGFSESVALGAEHLDNVGRRSFKFDGGEVDLTDKLPEQGKFKLRATALDYNGVGKVSDVYVLLEYPDRDDADDLKDQ